MNAPQPSHPTPLPSVFSPLAKALLDGFSEGVVVFDASGKVLYANSQARAQLEGDVDLGTETADDLQPLFTALVAPAVLAGERVTTRAAIAGAAIFLGLAIVIFGEWRQQRVVPVEAMPGE